MSTKITRTFTPDELEELGVPDDDEAIHTEQVDSRRWTTTHHAVFRAEDDGPLWRVTYYKPATEMQDCYLWGADADRTKLVTATQVEPYQVEITKYRPVVQRQPCGHCGVTELPHDIKCPTLVRPALAEVQGAFDEVGRASSELAGAIARASSPFVAGPAPVIDRQTMDRLQQMG